MANMSYCRMENTFQDLRDCYDNWDDADSERELKYQKKILEMCRKIINAFDEDGEYVKHDDAKVS